MTDLEILIFVVLIIGILTGVVYANYLNYEAKRDIKREKRRRNHD